MLTGRLCPTDASLGVAITAMQYQTTGCGDTSAMELPHPKIAKKTIKVTESLLPYISKSVAKPHALEPQLTNA
jgi:hypothetical protein